MGYCRVQRRSARTTSRYDQTAELIATVKRTEMANLFSVGFKEFSLRSTRRLRLETLETRHLLAAMPELVKDINATAASSAPGQLTEVGGIVFFTASTSTTGNELWKSDGTEAGTVRVKDIYPGSLSSYPSY